MIPLVSLARIIFCFILGRLHASEKYTPPRLLAFHSPIIFSAIKCSCTNRSFHTVDGQTDGPQEHRFV